MNSFATIEDVEADLMTISHQIGRDIGTADDDNILIMMENLSQLAWYLSHIAVDTNEWSVYAACCEYRDSLRAVYDNLEERLLTN